MNSWSEHKQNCDNKHYHAKGRRQGSSTGKSAFIHIEPILVSFYHVQKLIIQPLSVKIDDRVFEWILISLFTFAFVSTGEKPSTINWNTLENYKCLNDDKLYLQIFLMNWKCYTYIGCFFVTLMRSFKRVSYMVFSVALINVKHLDVHRHRNCTSKS